MSGTLRKDVDFKALFRKLGHDLTEIRVRALENILSKLEHSLICEEDIVHEKLLYIRLLEWFNLKESSHKPEVLSLLNRLSQHSAGGGLLQDMGGVEFLSQLRCDIEPCHRPNIDQILENIFRLPDPEGQGHAPECIYVRPSDSAIWGASMSSAGDGSRSHVSHISESPGHRVSLSNFDKVTTPQCFNKQGYFATPNPQADKLNTAVAEWTTTGEAIRTGSDFWRPVNSTGEQEPNLFRLSTFPWQPLTQTDQQVIASTNGSLQAKDPGLLISGCEFLADVVFQDFPAEIFLQRPEILKSLLSLVSLPSPSDVAVAVQACQALSTYIRCLQSRIRFFQDPVFYTSKQEFNSSTPSNASTTSSSVQRIPTVGSMSAFSGWDAKRLRGDGQDEDSSTSASRESSIGLELDSNMNDDLDLDEGPQLQSRQLTLPQLCVAILQRVLPQLRTSTEVLGVRGLELIQETLTVLVCVVDAEVWSEASESVRDVADRLIDCLEILAELLSFHHHNRHAMNPIEPDLGDLCTHRILYMGLVSFMTRFLTLVPLEKMKSVIPEKLKSALCSVVFDGALSLTFSDPRSVALTITQKLDLSTAVDFDHVVTVCRSLTKTCVFSLHWNDGITSAAELANHAEEAVLSLHYNMYLPFVERFVSFFSRICSKKKTGKPVISQCTQVLLKLMAYPRDEVRKTCYSSIANVLKESLQVSHATAPKSKESLKSKFIMHHNLLYELACFGMADGNKTVQNSAHASIHHLLASQLLMSEALWQELIMALSKCLPVLQSYTDQNTLLGRRLWAMLDPTSSTHNLPLLDKIRGSLRLLFLSDKSLRLQSAKHLKWFLCNEPNKETKLPALVDIDINVIENAFVTKSTQLIDEDNSRSVFTEEGLKQVYNIFTSDPVDEGVKKSAGEQLAIMMKDPHLHSTFRAMGGVDVVTAIINRAVSTPQSRADKEMDPQPCLAACLSMLKNLTHHDYSLRHSFGRDHDLYYCLIRAMLSNLDNEDIRSDVSHILTLLLFDEVAKFDISHGKADEPGTRFSLPSEVIQRYRLPFKPSCHHVTSPHAVSLPDADTDVMTLNGPQQMMRIAWNLAWQGGLDLLLDSFGKKLFSETNKEFNSVLCLTPVDCTVLEMSSLKWKLPSTLNSIKTAASHENVRDAVDLVWQYCSVFKVPALVEFFSNTDWYSSLEKFLSITPSSASDQSLLSHILRFLTSAISCVSPRQWGHGSISNPILTWLSNKLFAPGTSIAGLIARPMGGATDKNETSLQRNLDKELIRFLTAIHCRLPYQLCFRPKPGLSRGSLVKRLQDRLNITDAPHFYNLASLEGALSCLMHVTARPGWSKECESLDATTLCSQLLNSLLEVVWSFHIGRGGTCRSFMGKGVTKSSTLCLRHLAYEMAHNSEDPNWVKNWLYSRQDTEMDTDQGLNWLLTLWAYRDAEVRAAGVGIAVAMTSTEAGRLLVTSNCKHIPGGVWGASFSIMLDPQECSVVCQQAALLLVNLTSQAMSSGDVETVIGTTWQGPLVTDADYQVVLVGTKALEALVEHTNFYAIVSERITSWYAPSLIQPILVTIEMPLALEMTSSSTSTSSTTANSSASDGASMDKTLLTSVSSMSGQPTPNSTARTKQTASSDRSKNSARSVSSSSQVRTPRASQGTQQGNITSDPSSALQGQNIASSSLLAAMVKLMTNFVTLTPQTSLTSMRSHSIMSSFLSMIKPKLVHEFCTALTSGQADSATALALRDMLSLYSSIADLLATCITIDTNSRMELLSSQAGIEALMSLLLLQWPGSKDDIGDTCSSLSVSILRVFSALLQKQGAAALDALTPVLGPLWSNLAESLCTMLDDSTPSRIARHFASLDFLALLCCEEAKSCVKNPDRVLKEASVSELLDYPLGDESTEEKEDKDNSTTGKILCKVLISAFEIVNSMSKDERSSTENDRRLKVINAFKCLLTVSQSAKSLALEFGIAESLVEHIKQTHAQLTLETLGLGKGKGRKEEPFLQELIMTFDLIKNFMYSNPDVKLACHHSGLTGVVLKLWAWCLHDSGLLTSTLGLLISYSAHCNSAASSFATNASSSAVGVKSGNQNCLLNSILKLSQREINREECTPTLKLLFTLLSNVAVNNECRNLLWKSPFLQQVTKINPRRNKAKLQVAMDTLWCELLLSLSFTTDGHQIILKIPDILTVLMDLMEAGSTRCQHCATMIVRNLCCHAPNKPKLLASENFVSSLVHKIEQTNDEQNQLVASSALWALVHNNHKARVQVKSANVSSSLVETLQDILAECQKSPITSSTVENLRSVVEAIRE